MQRLGSESDSLPHLPCPVALLSRHERTNHNTASYMLQATLNKHVQVLSPGHATLWPWEACFSTGCSVLNVLIASLHRTACLPLAACIDEDVVPIQEVTAVNSMSHREQGAASKNLRALSNRLAVRSHTAALHIRGDIFYINIMLQRQANPKFGSWMKYCCT